MKRVWKNTGIAVVAGAAILGYAKARANFTVFEPKEDQIPQIRVYESFESKTNSLGYEENLTSAAIILENNRIGDWRIIGRLMCSQTNSIEIDERGVTQSGQRYEFSEFGREYVLVPRYGEESPHEGEVMDCTLEPLSRSITFGLGLMFRMRFRHIDAGGDVIPWETRVEDTVATPQIIEINQRIRSFFAQPHSQVHRRLMVKVSRYTRENAQLVGLVGKNREREIIATIEREFRRASELDVHPQEPNEERWKKRDINFLKILSGGIFLALVWEKIVSLGQKITIKLRQMKMKENEKLMKEYMKKRHELVERLVKATTIEECQQIRREFTEVSTRMSNADRELYLTEATGNARLDRGIDEKIERLRNPEKYKAYILDPPPDIPADKVDLVERERLKQEYLGKLNDIVRRAKETRTPWECAGVQQEFLDTRDYEKIDPALFRSLEKERKNAFKEIAEHQKKLAQENKERKQNEGK
jgi:hypothetical protein